MSKLSKLVKQFLANPSDVGFEEVVYILRAFEFEEVRSKGSHHIFRNSNGTKITVPKKGGQRVKRVYIKQIVDLLNLQEWSDEQEDGE
jgi:predicted RNA binding protein YcfA (HicA-like mRNA interferase family)